jgi:hypothetical protein
MTAITLAGMFGLVIFSINQQEQRPSGTESDAAVLATTARRLAA